MDAWIAATEPGGDLLFSFSEFQNAELLSAVYNLTESAMNRKLVCMQTKRASGARDATSSYVPKWRAKRQSFNGSSKHTGSALQGRTWGDSDKIQTSTSKQRLRLCRMKGDRIPGRDRLHEQRGCIHWDGARDGSSLSRTSSGATPQFKRYVTYWSEVGTL